MAGTAVPGGAHTDPGVLDRGSPMPLWAQLRADLLRRLDAGAFSQEFPGEMALVTVYQVSRHTVRTALRELRAQGVVLAERGRRPRVADQPVITQPLGALYSLFASVEAAGLRQASIVRSRDLRADGVIADRLGLEGAAPLFRLERLRLADDEPLALDVVWLPGDLGESLMEADFSHTALYEELAARTSVRLDSGREHIRAVAPTSAERHLLAIPSSAGALAIGRLSYSAGRPVEWRSTLIRGDRFSLLAEFSPRTGYQLAMDGRYPATLPLSGHLHSPRPTNRSPQPAGATPNTGSLPAGQPA